RHSVVSTSPFQFRTITKTSGSFLLLHSGTTPFSSGHACVSASATPLLRQDTFVKTLDLGRVLDTGFHPRHSGGKAAYFTGILHQILHLRSEVSGVPHSEQQSTLAVFHELSQRADI